MNSIDLQYQKLLQDILDNGVEKKDRTGTGTISVFGRQIRHKMSEGFPLLTTKKMAFKTMVTELLWFLRGDTNIKYLVDNNCHIWDGDAYKNYCSQIPEYSKQFTMSKEEFIEKIKTDIEFAKKWGSLGKIYGYQWRNWNGEIDQISELIEQIKENPDSRRLLVSAWNASDLPHQVLPPCHYGFQVYTRELNLGEKRQILIPYGLDPLTDKGVEELWEREKLPKKAISLMFNMRSNDVPLGLPFNIASYGLLLEIIAKYVNMVTDELIVNIGDAHIYLNQIEGVREQLTRTPYELPTVKISDRTVSDISEYEIEDFILENYQSHMVIKIPLSN
jgi:thymidylate synthase